MKHGSLISPDEAPFGFGASNAATIETISTHGDGADFVTVPDAHLLFSGEFKHSGNDLKIVGDDGKSFLVTDYFKNDKRPTLSSPEGATLSGDIVDLLAGPLAAGQYAQAGAPQPSANEAVGRVAVVTGNVTIIRNGVTVTVNAGDTILKNDVIQTGAGATCGLALNDGSTFNLTGGARLAINEFVYDPNGTANASLTTLIQGAATFVAGQIAKTGDMKVATPVATMGIRGTAVILDINAADGRVSISVVDERDNKEHNVQVFDRNGNLIATATSIGGKLFLTPTATFEVIASFTNKTPDQVAAEFAAFQAVLSTYDAAKQWFPNLPDRAEVNPKGNQHAQGTDIQPSEGSGSKTLPDPPKFGDKVVVVEVSNKTTTDTQGNTGNPNGNNNPDPTNGPDNPQPTPLAITYIYGSTGNDDGHDTGHPILVGGPGVDYIFGGPGDDVIEGGDGRGNDFYDGGDDFDKLIYPSVPAGPGVIFNLYGIAEQNTADDAPGGAHIDHDVFTNFERIESGDGDDVFVLHSDANWEIDAGGGFDTIKLAEDVNILAGEGPDASNLEMVDLTYGGKHIVEFEGGGVDENNPNQVLRVVGDSQDVVILTHGDASGHWVKVGSPQTDVNGGEGLFSGNDHHTDGVQFQEYEFVDNNGQVTASIYIDTNVTADIAPEVTLPPQTYLAFDGNDYAASAPASTQIDNVTIEGWIRWDGTPGNGHGQVLFYNGNTSTAGYGVFGEVINGTFHLSALAGGQNVMSSDAYLSAGEWHHVALVRVDEEFHLYVDGVEAGLANATSWVNDIITEDDYSAPDHTMIGGNPTNANEGFHGDIADVRLWDVARTEQEIADARFGSLDGDETGLAGYWPLTEGTGTSAPDHTPDGTSLEFNGAPLWTTGLNIDEDQTAKITDIQVVDPDAGDGQMQVTLSVAHGALELVDESDVSVQTDANGNITISGTLSDVNAALAAGVLFIPDANYNGSDALHIVVTDANGGTSARDVAITLAPVDEAPLAPALDLDANDSSGATGSGFQTAATFGTFIAILDSDATITGASTLDGATITLTGEGFGGNTDYPDTQLKIDATLLEGATFDDSTFEWSWHGITWYTTSGQSGMDVHISGNGTNAEYLEVLHAARMSFDEDTSNTGASVTITVSNHDVDSNIASTAVDIPNRAPDINVYAFNSANETIDETDQPPSISKTLTISDTDQDLLTVTVTDLDADGPLGAHSESDFLGFLWVDAPTSGAQYTWTFGPNNETFGYLAENESLILHYTVHASDGSATDDQIVNITINGMNDAAVVDAHGAEVNYTLGGAGVAVGGDISLSDIDSATLQSATIRIDNFQNGDVLSIGDFDRISSYFDSDAGALVLSGVASVADYQAALRSISYQNNDPFASAGDRTITYQVDDGATANHASNVATSTIHVDAGETPNEPPVVNGEELTGDIAGFTYNSANGHWYKAADIADYKSWSDAQAAAVAAGGYLATITSLDENQFILDLLTDVQSVWIGGSDSDEEGVWRWVGGPEDGLQFWQGGDGGVPLLYANWHADEPNAQSGEDFVIIGEDGTWYDFASATSDDAREYVTEVSIVEDVDSVIPAAFLLANDSDPEGQSLSIHSVSATSANGGTVTLLDNGNVQYHSAQDYNGPDSFTYKVTDGENVSTEVTVTFNVAPANEAPVIHTDEAFTGGNEAYTILAGLSIVDTDAGADPYFGVNFQAEHGFLQFADEEALPSEHYISFNGTLANINNKIGEFGGIVYVAPTADPEDPETNLIETVTMTANDGHGGTDTLNFIFNAVGPGGVSLTGTNQKDVLFGTGGNDTLEGGAGADTFVFDRGFGENEHDIGFDQVTDFVVGVDKIDLGSGFDSVPMTQGGDLDFYTWFNNSEVNGHDAIEQVGINTVIHLSDNEDITLKNVVAANLSASDFIVHSGSHN